MSTRQTPVTALALSLTAGVLMLVSGIVGYLWFTGTGINYGFGMMSGYHNIMGGFSGMMNGFQNMMTGFGVPFGDITGFSIIGLISGILVLVGAIMLSARPAQHMTWGAIIIAFSVVSLFGMGGFYVGALIGIAGGALALAWRPRSTTPTQA